MSESTRDSSPGPKRLESRHFPRYRIDVRVVVKLRREPGGELLLRGRSTDISQSGMGVTLSGDLQPGEAVHMEFSLPFTREPLHLRAVVRRRNGLNYGVEFLTLSAAQRAAIERLCEPLSGHD
jgi:c-di-GMP-binding flagellar brake protein YcgR